MRTFLLLIYTKYFKITAGRELVWMEVWRKAVSGIDKAEFLINAGNFPENATVTVQATQGISVDAVSCVHLNGIDDLQASFCLWYGS